jgi:hypothetical protein
MQTTYTDLLRKLKDLELQREKTTIGTPEYKKLTEEAAEATAKLKELDAAVGFRTISVGDYNPKPYSH